MKTISISVIILLALLTHAVCPRSGIQNDSTFKKDDPVFIKNIGLSKLTGYQFQLRLYFGTGGNRIIPQYYLFLITLKNDAWTACQYTFTGKPVSRFSGEIKIDSELIKINNYKKLFKHLKKDGLLHKPLLARTRY